MYPLDGSGPGTFAQNLNLLIVDFSISPHLYYTVDLFFNLMTMRNTKDINSSVASRKGAYHFIAI